MTQCKMLFVLIGLKLCCFKSLSTSLSFPFCLFKGLFGINQPVGPSQTCWVAVFDFDPCLCANCINACNLSTSILLRSPHTTAVVSQSVQQEGRQPLIRQLSFKMLWLEQLIYYQDVPVEHPLMVTFAIVCLSQHLQLCLPCFTHYHLLQEWWGNDRFLMPLNSGGKYKRVVSVHVRLLDSSAAYRGQFAV